MALWLLSPGGWHGGDARTTNWTQCSILSQFKYSKAKCFLKAKCFGTVTPCHNSQTKRDNVLKIRPNVDYIDGIADKKSQGAGYTRSLSIGEILNFLIFFPEHIWSLWLQANLLHIK